MRLEGNCSDAGLIDFIQHMNRINSEPKIRKPQPEIKKLKHELQNEIKSKSEIIAAQRYTAGIHSLFWQTSKMTAKQFSQQEIDRLPDDLKRVVKTARAFVK